MQQALYPMLDWTKKAEQLPNVVNLSNQIYAREQCPSHGMYVLE
jgi:hypothetical protein